jgi:hypothetical protein
MASARAHGIAERNQGRAGDVIAAQQIGVALGDTPATEQAESDHWASFAAVTAGLAKPFASDGAGRNRPLLYIKKSRSKSRRFGRNRRSPGGRD